MSGQANRTSRSRSSCWPVTASRGFMIQSVIFRGLGMCAPDSIDSPPTGAARRRPAGATGRAPHGGRLRPVRPPRLPRADGPRESRHRALLHGRRNAHISWVRSRSTDCAPRGRTFRPRRAFLIFLVPGAAAGTAHTGRGARRIPARAPLLKAADPKATYGMRRGAAGSPGPPGARLRRAGALPPPAPPTQSP